MAIEFEQNSGKWVGVRPRQSDAAEIEVLDRGMLLDEGLDIHKFQNFSRNKRLVTEREKALRRRNRRPEKVFQVTFASTVTLGESIVRVNEAALR